MTIPINTVLIAWTEFVKAQSEGITDHRSMERALEAVEKYMVAAERDACAQIADAAANAKWADEAGYQACTSVAAAIRARGLA